MSINILFYFGTPLGSQPLRSCSDTMTIFMSEHLNGLIEEVCHSCFLAWVSLTRHYLATKYSDVSTTDMEWLWKYWIIILSLIWSPHIYDSSVLNFINFHKWCFEIGHTENGSEIVFLYHNISRFYRIFKNFCVINLLKIPK